jgi:hypothetical protein
MPTIKIETLKNLLGETIYKGMEFSLDGMVWVVGGYIGDFVILNAKERA